MSSITKHERKADAFKKGIVRTYLDFLSTLFRHIISNVCYKRTKIIRI